MSTLYTDIIYAYCGFSTDSDTHYPTSKVLCRTCSLSLFRKKCPKKILPAAPRGSDTVDCMGTEAPQPPPRMNINKRIGGGGESGTESG